jgi:LmbE family N-acetylglucosaminyl deacetylase
MPAKVTQKKRPRTKAKPDLVRPVTLLRGVRPVTPKKPVKKKSSQRKPKKPLWRVLRAEQWFALVGLGILIASTVYWALLGAHSNAANSDQLVDSYLFENWKTFQGAQFPAAHTFFLKWPLFALGAALGNTPNVLVVLTVAIVLATVLALAWVLWRIIRRPIPWTLLILSLALTLLLVPIQPSPSTLLPLNMAMLTTRNLEYVVYVVGLMLAIRVVRPMSRRGLVLVALWGVLFLSDRLFVPLAFGSLALLGVFGWLRHRRELVLMARHGLVCAALGFGLSLCMLAAIMHGTSVVSVTAASPYHIASGKDMSLGLVYGVLAVLANLGINPAPTTLVLRDWFHAAFTNYGGIAGMAWLVMLLSGIGFAVFAWRSLRVRLRADAKQPHDAAQQLTGLLVASSVVACGLYVVTKHYYGGDGRYVTIVLFAVYIAAATMLRTATLPRRFVHDWAALLLVALIPATLVTYNDFSGVRAAQQPYATQNKAVVDILRQHPVQWLVGDYWRVLPVRALSGNAQAVVPLQTCTQPRQALTSSNWQVKTGDSFAYLLPLEKGQTDFPACTFNDVVAAYGRPSGSYVVGGTVAKPTELLLVFNKRSVPSEHSASTAPASTAPVELSDVAFADCPNGTVMQVVAHPDDDILFMSPDLPRSIAAGSCVRTVYLTAGDSGSAGYYWIGRMLGAQAAYETMTGVKRDWQFRTVRFSSGQYATYMNQYGNSQVSLLFLNLPDGNLQGQGFGGDKSESLRKLYEGATTTIHSVDGSSHYSSDELKGAIRELLEVFKPTELRTQTPSDIPYLADHSDHQAAARYVDAALQDYQPSWAAELPVAHYVGYPVHAAAPNVFDEALQQKQSVFLNYAAHDHGVCQTEISCQEDPAYGAYLTRQYTYEEFISALGL